MKPGRGLAVLAVPSSILLILVPMPSAGAAAPKADLHQEASRSSCPDGGTAGRVHGSAVLNKDKHSHRIIAKVSLKDAAPNHPYTVHVIQCQAGSNLNGGSSTVGTFKTNGKGNGTFHGRQMEHAGADHAFVGLDPGDAGPLYATSAVPI